MMKIYIYPTDTVWGIGASALDLESNLQIARIKGTDPNKPLSVLFGCFDQFLSYFSLPPKMDLKVLKMMFGLNSTLGIPSEWLKKEIPPQIYGGGDWIGVRCLEFALFKNLIETVGAPITTTSLNLTGEMPIIDEEKALKFSTNIPNCKFVPVIEDGPKPKGVSSSMIILSESSNVKVVRTGKFIQKLLEHAERLYST